MRGLRIIRRMHSIFIEWNGIRNLNRHPPDLHVDTRRSQHVHDLSVEVSNRSRLERYCLARAIAPLKYQLMVQKIELQLKRTDAIWDWRGGQATSTYIQRNVPPMVYQRSQRKADFTDDLRPHVESGIGVLPLLERKFGPTLHSGDIECFHGTPAFFNLHVTLVSV